MARIKPQAEAKGLPILRSYPPCSWSVDGEPCRYPGTMTKSTLAEPDTQWFCSKHFDCEDPVAGADIVAASRDYVHRPAGQSVAELQAEAAQYCKDNGIESLSQMRRFVHQKARLRQPPSTGWAQKIRERVSAGEQLPLISITLAEQVLATQGASSAAEAAEENGRAFDSAAEAVEAVEVGGGGDFAGGGASGDF